MDKEKSIKIYSMKSKMHQINHIHFIGIGGSGMGGIAKILICEGYHISGSDIFPNVITRYLSTLGAKIYFNHRSENVNNANVVVISSAIPFNNPEILSAKKQNIPIISRAEMLAELMRFRYGIAISGTHGKTTTTSILSSIYIESGLNPTFISGGIVKKRNVLANLGDSNYLIAEADESDASFLHLNPMVAIITNIDLDHMDTYQGEVENLKKAFVDFLHNLPFYGYAVVCIDNKIIREIIPNINRQIITYGFNEDADFKIDNYVQYGLQSHFNLIIKNQLCLKIILNTPGHHNVLNATAAIAVCYKEGIHEKYIIDALKNFEGTERRFDCLGIFPTQPINGNIGNAILIDDYGHHPTEINEIIQTMRSGWPSRQLIMIFQPHRYTRTRDLLNDFVAVLSKVDILLILNVYPAGEKIISGASSSCLCNLIQSISKINPILITENNCIPETLALYISGNDIILIQGAGDISQVALDLAEYKLQPKYKVQSYKLEEQYEQK
ncbi:UDP-N-acetylmuramate--L-alanine ligase [Candidatus Pantoea edessiphila]|uniref:UDP-N-acetylmuramate--L-alanine ligase n=1 Tax=Candidatus Pantoea edessiphila TaxID=2044610 RepID=A0A2P5SW84_9GAMM|nr:UDP-N-acetylmuramate--L-alanine ligase [Candidatus Pantoea edessiphila]PPI86599.1 UDP-N-acetylmuramate--L-alanine ligase [Candidatus Pantoea edessiphila]